MCEQVENILMRLLVPDNDVIRQVVTALFSGSKYLGNVPLGRIAVYGSTKLTLPDDSTGIRNIRSQDYSFPGTFVPMMELSFSGPFVPWNIRSLDRSFPGTFVPWTVHSMELSFPGTFVPGTLDLSCRGPFVHLSAEQYLVWNSVTNRSVVL